MKERLQMMIYVFCCTLNRRSICEHCILVYYTAWTHTEWFPQVLHMPFWMDFLVKQCILGLVSVKTF